jgi:uncharacterized protein
MGLAVRLLLLLGLLLPAAAGWAAEPVYPALTGRIVDEAAILSPGTRARLTEMLAEHEQKTGQQIVVVTLKSLQGLTIEDFGYQLGRHWGIGEKDKNTGALLITAPAERKVRIEVGYGLEGQLTDATSRIIIENDILPAFRRGDFNSGILDGTAAILRLLGGSGEARGPASRGAGQAAQNSETIIDGLFIVAIWIFVWWMLWRRRAGSMLPFFLLGGGTRQSGGFGGGGGFSGGGGSFGGGGATGSW